MMTIAMARLTVRTYLDRMGRFDPEGAHDLQQAITLLIEDAIERAARTPDEGPAPVTLPGGDASPTGGH